MYPGLHYIEGLMLGIFEKIIKIIARVLFKQEIFYVNGPDTLPPPLDTEEEIKAIGEMDRDPTKKTLLIEHNLRLVVYIAKKFENTGVGIEDLVSIGTIGLIKAVQSFSYEKNTRFSTYAARCIENAILSQMRLWFRINPPRAKKNTNGVFWHRFPRIFTSFAPLRTAM